MESADFVRATPSRARAERWPQRSLSVRQREEIQEMLSERGVRLTVSGGPSPGNRRAAHSQPLAVLGGRCFVISLNGAASRNEHELNRAIELQSRNVYNIV
jgi:hypothetical protein